jgi:hypothetical protein
MAYADTQVAGWMEAVKIGKESTAAFATEATYTDILPISNDVMLKVVPEVLDFGIRSKGVPYKAAADKAIGRQKPAFTIETALRRSILNWFATLAFQKFTAASSTPWAVTYVPYDICTAKYGMSIKKLRGATVGEGEKALGLVPTTVKISLGADGLGKISADCIACSVAKGSTLGTGETVIADAILGTKDFTVKLATVATEFMSLDLSIMTNAARIPRSAVTAAGISLGVFGITGTIKVYWFGNSGQRDLALAGTAQKFELLSGTPASTNEISLSCDIKFTDEGDVKEEENIFMQTLNFEQAYSSNVPTLVVGNSATWVWA